MSFEEYVVVFVIYNLLHFLLVERIDVSEDAHEVSSDESRRYDDVWLMVRFIRQSHLIYASVGMPDEYVAVEYPPTEEIMAELRDIEKQIAAEMDELERLLKA